ncbi:uncharacterized protein B0J16DRAFT_418286 [Fusarium flagelliforme]|uniref:uncharacterized protein n=1 Tax=Fusarium flagelliforme TaxID=2675880 RepID=UPI001E8E7019|nr:uncharacterized protein B0J16DRAFT_418286 [Fusarium flagelliforme]KAH7174855.1 hypothetical protein B0J16DRAFT_418286 [Fusarium flagelliforme]
MAELDSSRSEEMESLHRELEIAKAEKAKYEDLLNQSLERERKFRQALEQETELKEEYQELCKRNEALLNAHSITERKIKHLDDKFFIDKIIFLRQNIRHFAYQYFNSWVPKAKLSPASVQDMARILNLEPFAVMGSNPSAVVRAYIWRFLARKVFGRFVWAKPSEAMHELTEYLRSSQSSTSTADRDSRRQFDLWKAKTSTLLQTTRGTREDKTGNMAQSDSINQLMNTLAGLFGVGVRRIELIKPVNMIWAHAVEFDMLMHTQSSGIELYYGGNLSSAIEIDGSIMEVEPEGSVLLGGAPVNLVFEPALRRMGDSDGNESGQEVYLLKMVVACHVEELVTRKDGLKQGQTSKSLGELKRTGSHWGSVKRLMKRPSSNAR